MSYENLFKAVVDNDIKTVESILSTLDSSQLNEIVNENKQTPLMLAVLKNNLVLTTLLLKAGFDPSQKDITELPPFVAAAANGFDKVFSMLLSVKPDPKQVNRFGGTALLPSSEKGYLKTVQVALDYGVPVNHQNRLGWSGLLEAVILGDGGFLYQDIARELVDHGADVDAKDFESVSSREYAKLMKQDAILEILEKRHSDAYETARKLIREESLYEALNVLHDGDDTLQKYYYLGYTYERLGDLVAAQYYFEKGLELDPQFAFYLVNLVRRQGKTEEALDFFKQGAERTEGYYFDYHRSNYLRELGRHEEAVVLMDALLSEYPDRTDFMFHKANSLRTLNRHQEALDTMVEADRILPQNSLFKEQAEISKSLLAAQ